ncbi:MAG: hypothetical protein HYT40_03635 [Candidatus Sungbacteria bacterium]|uniref:Uncharacterized protein n=1 Tax=Candidatus Sungiibacteriota bacterium TaxID=2750080 RepID=A0A931SC52_9BACT|nr:hypothetical protein [Candidatus Sungbacteria bacterium]
MILRQSIDQSNQTKVVGAPDAMTPGLLQALQLVAQMRKAQKAYFKSRKQADLVESKRLETAVDMKLAELGIKAV